MFWFNDENPGYGAVAVGSGSIRTRVPPIAAAIHSIVQPASGYLLKHESAAVLEDAIVSVLETGGAPMSPAIARKALQKNL